MSIGEYLIGLLFFAIVLGGACACAFIIIRRRLAYMPLSVRITAGGLIATLAVVAFHLLPGVLGLLTREVVAATAALSLLGVHLIVSSGLSQTDGQSAREAGAHPGQRVGAIAGWVGLVLVAGYALAFLVANAGTPVFGYDQLGFKLPNVERWIERESIWGYDVFLPMKNTGSYPQNGDLAILAVVLPWDNDAFVRLTQLPFAALSAVAVYAGSRELGAPKAGALLASGLLVAMPVVTVAAFRNALPDTSMLFMFAAGVLFLLRHLRTASTADLILAGVGIGLALGTKWYGLSGAFLLIGVWASARLLARFSARRVLRDLGVVAGIAALSGGFWFIRNWVETGNPFYPVRLEVAGVSVLDAPVDLEQPIYGLSIAHYLGDGDAWVDHLLPAFRGQFAAAGLLLLVGALLVLPMVKRAKGVAGRGLVLVTLAISVLMVAAYVLTPYSGQGFGGVPNFAFVNTRWVVPALALWAVAAAWATASVRSALAWRALGLVSVVAIVMALRAGLSPPTWVLAIVLVLLGSMSLLVCFRREDVATFVTRRAVLVTAVAGLVVAGYVAQRDFNSGRYLGSDRTFDRVLEDEQGLNIGITGAWSDDGPQPTWAMFGQSLDNHVEYVGRIVEGRLVPYETKDEWLEAVEHGGFDYVLVGEEPHIVGDSLERIWARSTLQLVAESDRFRLYQLPREIDR